MKKQIQLDPVPESDGVWRCGERYLIEFDGIAFHVFDKGIRPMRVVAKITGSIDAVRDYLRVTLNPPKPVLKRPEERPRILNERHPRSGSDEDYSPNSYLERVTM